jgi:hypothetical protein
VAQNLIHGTSNAQLSARIAGKSIAWLDGRLVVCFLGSLDRLCFILVERRVLTFEFRYKRFGWLELKVI